MSVATLLLLSACTSQPVSAPSNPTSAPAASAPPESPCIPAEVISEATGTPTSDPVLGAGRLGMVLCTYSGGTGQHARIEYSTQSNEDTFAARRDTYKVKIDRGAVFHEVPGLFDEAYEFTEGIAGIEGTASTSRNVVLARHGPVEVWLSWTLPIADDHREDFTTKLFTKIFQRLE